MREIVLASASPRRTELMKQIGLEFTVFPSNIDESMENVLSRKEAVKNLSYAKAFSVAQRCSKSSLIIGADTIVVKNGILGKPENDQQAFDMLKSLQGGWHEVITGVSVIDNSSLKSIKACEITRVKMRKLKDDYIYSYINTGETRDKAGAYGIQGMGALLVEKIEGCYFNVVGLPLTRLSIMLEEFGVHVL